MLSRNALDTLQDAPGVTRGIVVGRGPELQTVLATLERLPAGSGGFLQIIGEPGIGKTHLLAATRALAVAHGFDVLSGRAAEFERRIPFHILIEALRDRLDGVELDELLPPSMSEVVRSITVGVGLPESPDQPDAPDIDRFRVFQALRQLLTALASRPLVLLLDDAHWADPGSIDFIEYLSRHPIDVPLLIVVAHRYRQAPEQLRYALARNSDHSTVTRIELGPLSLADAATLIRERPGSFRLGELYRESRGNPLYLLSLERQAGPSGAARWAGPSRRLEALILGEIITLSAEEAAVAATAAVVGDPFSVDLLISAADLGEQEVQSALRGLMDHDLIRSVPNSPSLAFRHPLVRRVVYNRADPAWRTGVHRRVIAQLTALGSPALELAHHIEQSAAGWSAHDAAVLRRAGHESMSTSPLTAAHWFKAAQSMMPGSADFDADRFEVSYLLARALCLGGRFSESRDLLHQILLDVPADGGVNRSAAVILCAHVEQRLGRYPEAIALLRREIARLGEDAPHERERIGLCLELGLTALLANDYPAARPEITWALAATRETGDVLGEATALAFSAFGEICVGHVAVARQAARDAAQLVDGLPDRALADEREALSMLGWAELLLEQFADAERHLVRGRAIIHRTGQSHGLPHVLLGQCLVSMFTGRMTEALERAEQAEDAAHLVGSDHLLGIVLAIKAPILVWVSPMGEGSAALAAARRTTELFEGSGASWWARSALLTRGHAELTNGDPATCVDLLLKAGGPDLRLLGAPLLPEYAEILIGALLKLGELDQAAEYAELATSFAHELGLPGQKAHAARARGLVLALRGDQPAARLEFARADAWFGESGKSVEQARTAVFAARTLAILDRSDEALALLGRSAAQARASGALWVSDELDRVRDQLNGASERTDPATAQDVAGTGSGPRRGTPDSGASAAAASGGATSAAAVAPQRAADAFSTLTERELEVAGLAGVGRTNRQIASQLRLSERTVESHLANVYRKLGVSSRAALAGMVATRHMDEH